MKYTSIWFKEKTKSMFSLIFSSLNHKQETSQMTRNDTEKKAISLLALLKTDEEKLIQEARTLLKTNRLDAQGIFSVDVDGWTLFHACALRGCRKVLKLALKAGVDVNLKMGEPEGIPGGCSALHLAAHRGDVSVIDILLSNRAYVNQSDHSGKTPIYYASNAHNSLAVKALKRAGADMSQCPHQVPYDKLPPITEETNSSFCLLPFPGCSGTKTKR